MIPCFALLEDDDHLVSLDPAALPGWWRRHWFKRAHILHPYANKLHYLPNGHTYPVLTRDTMNGGVQAYSREHIEAAVGGR